MTGVRPAQMKQELRNLCTTAVNQEGQHEDGEYPSNYANDCDVIHGWGVARVPVNLQSEKPEQGLGARKGPDYERTMCSRSATTVFSCWNIDGLRVVSDSR